MIALTFAKAITRHTGDAEDLIARCGRCCLFSTLQEMFPLATRSGPDGHKDGVSEVEFNKLLQVLKIIAARLDSMRLILPTQSTEMLVRLKYLAS